MDKVRWDQEVSAFEDQGWWKTLWLVFTVDLCKHKHWVSGGLGAFCWRCLARVEPTDV